MTGDSARQQTPYRCQSRNQGLCASISSCLRFAAERSLEVSGLISGASNISCSCSISSMMRSTSMAHNHLRQAAERSNRRHETPDTAKLVHPTVTRCGGVTHLLFCRSQQGLLPSPRTGAAGRRDAGSHSSGARGGCPSLPPTASLSPCSTAQKGSSFQPCQKRVLISQIQPIWVNFERRADSPNY
jgi:hypothetical protein